MFWCNPVGGVEAAYVKLTQETLLQRGRKQRGQRLYETKVWQ